MEHLLKPEIQSISIFHPYTSIWYMEKQLCLWSSSIIREAFHRITAPLFLGGQTMKLFVKLRGSGEVRKVDLINVLMDKTIFCYAESPESIQLDVDCDLCDEQGRLLVPQEEDHFSKYAGTSLYPNMISKDDALAFILWAHMKVFIEYEHIDGPCTYFYDDDDDNEQQVEFESLAECYEYWKTNIKEDKQ